MVREPAATERAWKHPFLRHPKYSLSENGDQRAAHKLQLRWRVRCVVCGRKLHPKMILRFFAEEFVEFVVPEHKPRL